MGNALTSQGLCSSDVIEGVLIDSKQCCAAVRKEIIFEVNCDAVEESSDIADGGRAPVQSRWMQKPVLAAFEKRLQLIEQHKQTLANLMAQIVMIEQEKQAAAAREDYDSAKHYKGAQEALIEQVKIIQEELKTSSNRFSAPGPSNGKSNRTVADISAAEGLQVVAERNQTVHSQSSTKAHQSAPQPGGAREPQKILSATRRDNRKLQFNV